MERIKSQKKIENDKERSNAKSSLINKVNDGQKLTSASEDLALNKLNFAMNANDITKEIEEEINPFTNNQGNKPRKAKKRFFFFRLSLIAKVMFVIYLIGFSILGYLTLDFFSNRGKPILEGRDNPVKVISNDQVKEIEAQIQSLINPEKLSVDYIAYRLVIVLDIDDAKSEEDARYFNGEIMNMVNNVTPFAEYFSGNDKDLSNDLVIYTTDLIPDNPDQNSRYVIETYKNSQMAEALTYNLLAVRDEASYNRVMESYKKAQEGQ